MLKVLARKLHLTENELKVLIFFTALYCGGLIIKNFSEEETQPKNYDYSETDRLYDSLNENFNGAEFSEDLNDEEKKPVAKDNFSPKESTEKFEPKIEPKEQSIGINSASIEQLMTLPGIGKRTAENILKYKEKFGWFKKIDDLLNVKGIGKSRLENIKKYIYIDTPKLKR